MRLQRFSKEESGNGKIRNIYAIRIAVNRLFSVTVRF